MKTAIATVFSALSSSLHSHNSGLARIASRQLREAGVEHDVLWTDSKASKSWDDYDRVYVYHGYDLNGKLGINMFGGTIQPNADRLAKLATFNGELIPIWYPWPDYVKLASLDRWGGLVPKSWITALKKRTRADQLPFKNPLKHEHLTIGDSHAPSVWTHGTQLEVLSGQTLHSVVSRREPGVVGPVEQLIRSYAADGVRRLTINFGNIDLRHHLARQPSPTEACTKLAASYLDWLERLTRHMPIDFVEVCALLPVESEDREIPGPGMYRGQPFHGSWEQRTRLREVFNKIMREYCRTHRGFSFYEPPAAWTNEKGELDQSVMERPRSVHIAPKFYRAFR